MSGYQARRGPAMNQYIANLNAVPSPQESVPSQEFGNLEDELALFTNTEFLTEFDLGDQERLADGKNVGFDDGFRLNEFPYAPQAAGPAGIPNLQGFHGQPQPAGFFPGAVPAHAAPYIPSTPTAASPAQAGDSLSGSGPHSPCEPLEGQSRVAAEEDKRRRNTAASARFRVKKKQREQALEKTAKDMTDRVDKLVSQVAELERENKWLRGLVVEKSGGTKEDVSKLLTKVTQEARKGDSTKKGVGTVTEAEPEAA